MSSKTKKYNVTFSKTYVVSAKSDQEAKESSMIVWERKNHPVNIKVEEIKSSKGTTDGQAKA